MIFFFAINLFLLVSNVVKYLVPLKVRSNLLALFYIFAGIMTVANMAGLVFFVTSDNVMSLTNPREKWQQSFGVVATSANVIIGFLFVATMYQISQSIKMIDDPLIDIEKAHKRKVCVYVAALGASILIAIAMTVGLIVLDYTD